MNKEEEISTVVPAIAVARQENILERISAALFNNLRAKFLWPAISLIIALSIFLTASSIYIQQRSMDADLKTFGLSTIRSLANDSELGLLTENQDFIRPVLKDLTNAPTFFYAAVYNKDGDSLGVRSIVADNDDYIATMPGDVTHDLSNDKVAMWNEREINGEVIYEFWSPVLIHESEENEDLFLDNEIDETELSIDVGSILGFVRYGVSRKGIRDALHETLLASLTILAIFLPTSFSLAFLMSTRVTRPIAKLVKLSEEVAEGSLDNVIDITSKDEVGKLALSFNVMISSVKARDHELRKAHDELEKRVEERTAEINKTNQELSDQIAERTQAQSELADLASRMTHKADQLEKSNKDLDQFAYVAAHDLKAPLCAIANLSRWIEEDVEDQLSDESREHMDLLRGRVQRLENLIDGILQYSRLGRIDGGQLEVVNAGIVIDQIIEMLSPPPSFTVERDQHMPTFKCSVLLFEQVLSNLIGNAIKYHDKEAGNVNISFKDADDLYEFSVADDGPGIDPEYHEKVFMIFQTLQARDTKESTGIGLTIVKKIIEEQGGKISLDSNEGRGTTFRFTWPKMPRINKGE